MSRRGQQYSMPQYENTVRNVSYDLWIEQQYQEQLLQQGFPQQQQQPQQQMNRRMPFTQQQAPPPQPYLQYAAAASSETIVTGGFPAATASGGASMLNVNAMPYNYVPASNRGVAPTGIDTSSSGGYPPLWYATAPPPPQQPAWNANSIPPTQAQRGVQPPPPPPDLTPWYHNQQVPVDGGSDAEFHQMQQQMEQMHFTDEDELLIDVKMFLDELTSTPEFLGSISEAISCILLQQPIVTLLYNVVDLIIEQGCSMSNFTYVGAKLCEQLWNSAPTIDNSSFRDVFKIRMSEKFEVVKAEVVEKRFVDCTNFFLIFLGECYISVRSKDAGGSVTEFRQMILELLPLIISSMDTIKSAVQLLKMSGQQLESEGGESASIIAQTFDSLAEKAAKNQYDLSTVATINKLIELRSTKWRRSDESSSVAAAGGSGAIGGQHIVSEIDGYTYFNNNPRPEDVTNGAGGEEQQVSASAGEETTES